MASRLRTALSVSLALAPMSWSGCASLAPQPVAVAPMNRVELTMNSARLEESRGNWAIALSLYGEVNRQQPTNVDCLQRMGVISTHLNQHEAAKRYYQMAYAIDPSNSELLADMGFSAFQRKDYVHAEEYLEQSFRLNSNSPRIVDNLAIARAWRNKDEASLAAFRMIHSEVEAQRRYQSVIATRERAKQAAETAIVAVGTPKQLALTIPVTPPPVSSRAPELATVHPIQIPPAISQPVEEHQAINVAQTATPSTEPVVELSPELQKIASALAVPDEELLLPPSPEPRQASPVIKKVKELKIASPQVINLESVEMKMVEKPQKASNSAKPMSGSHPVSKNVPDSLQVSVQTRPDEQLNQVVEAALKPAAKVEQPAVRVITEVTPPVQPIQTPIEQPLKALVLQVPEKAVTKTTDWEDSQPRLSNDELADCDGVIRATPSWRYETKVPIPESSSKTISVDQWRKSHSTASADEPLAEHSRNEKPQNEWFNTGKSKGWGVCLVTLAEKKQLESGRPEFQAQTDKYQLEFASDEARQKFKRNPERYLPAAGGIDVVAQFDWGTDTDGLIEFAAWYEGRLFVFSSRENAELFLRAPQRYLNVSE